MSDKRITDIPFDAYWDTNKPDRWHLVSGDERFGKGFWIVVTSNPLSADYRPREFNRGLRAFHDLGVWSHPEAKEAPEYNRHIAERIGVIVQHLRDNMGLTESAHERAHSILDEAGVGDPNNDELGDRITQLVAERDQQKQVRERALDLLNDLHARAEFEGTELSSVTEGDLPEISALIRILDS